MKIVYLAAGAANMYCGSCLHDNTLAAALSQLGEDALLVPTYTPLRTDETNVSEQRVFFGGINVYLQQMSAIFRHTPWWIDGLFDSPAIMQWLSRRNLSTQPEELGALTVSMLAGEAGNQRKEVDKLVRWLAHEVKPDVVHLSNSMLLGMAHEIRHQVGVPVVCSLSGEDIFLEKLREPYYTQARELLRQRAADADRFVALNRYFADFMTEYIQLDPAKVRVVRHGLNLDGHGTREKRGETVPVRIGYFARICPDKGLHQLAEAFRLLCDDPDLPELKLCAAGYLGKADRPYLTGIQTKLRESGLAEKFEYLGELNRAEKIDFLQSLDLMSVPTVYHESKGISVIEAMANGVPVVVPSHGTWPELIRDTGGGILAEPADDPKVLAASLKRLIVDRKLNEECGRRGQAAIHQRYTAATMAQETLDLYKELIDDTAKQPTRDAVVKEENASRN